MLGPLLTKATPQQPAITHSTAGLSFPWKGMEIAFIFQEQRDQLTPTSPVSSHPCPVPASVWLHKDLETLWRPGEWKDKQSEARWLGLHTTLENHCHRQPAFLHSGEMDPGCGRESEGRGTQVTRRERNAGVEKVQAGTRPVLIFCVAYIHMWHLIYSVTLIWVPMFNNKETAPEGSNDLGVNSHARMWRDAFSVSQGLSTLSGSILTRSWEF